MSHEFTDETLAAYVLGELVPEQAERVERELASSAELRARIEELSRAHDLLLGSAREEGPALSQEAKDRLFSEAGRHARALRSPELQQRTSRRLRRARVARALPFHRSVLFATLAAAAAVLLAVYWFSAPGPGGLRPSPRELDREIAKEPPPAQVPHPAPAVRDERSHAARAPVLAPPAETEAPAETLVVALAPPAHEDEVARAPELGPAPAKPPERETARVMARLDGLEQTLYYKRGDSDRWFQASEGAHLAVGDSLDTRMGLAALELEGGGRVFCNRRTWVTFDDAKAFLHRGEVYCEFAPGGGLAIATADGVVRHIGTSFSVKAAPSGTTVTVAEGRVEVANERDKVEVGEGFQLSVRKGSAPGRARRVDVRHAVAWMKMRVTVGLQALYLFDEGRGRIARDASGVGQAADLALSGEDFGWAAGGLSFNAADHDTIATTASPPEKLCASSTATDQLTLEAWFRPHSLSQVGPPRILTYEDPLGEAANQRNWAVCQHKDGINFRLRTSHAGGFGHVDLFTTGKALRSTKKTCHVVCTYKRGQGMRVYVDGALSAVNDESGTFDVVGDNAWDASYILSVGNRTGSLDRDWEGTIFLAALYERALSRAEIRQNFLAGPNPRLAAAPRNGRR